MGRLVPVEGVGDLRAPAVRRAAAAEEDPAVGGAVQVVDRVAGGGDELAVAPADLLPQLRRERLGQDDQGVERDHRPPQLRQLGQVRLAGEDQCLGPDLAVGGQEAGVAARLPVDHRRLFPDRRPFALDGAGEAADHPAGVDRRAVRHVDRALHVGDVDPAARLVGVEELVVLPEAERHHLVVAGDHRGELVLAAGEAEDAPLLPLGVDLLLLEHAVDLADGLVHGAGDGAGGLRAVLVADRAERDREAGVAPAAVAAGRAEAGNLSLEDADLERGVALQQVVGGPEAGEPGPQHGDVDVGRAVEPRPRREVVAAGLEPVGVGPVVLHRRSPRNGTALPDPSVAGTATAASYTVGAARLLPARRQSCVGETGRAAVAHA